jgi:aspartyl-tRNA(Asn)/glutamyl-tRNA(Gln) amidotransferase subunit A
MSAALVQLGIAEASRLIDAGSLSPVDLTRAYLDRIATIDPVLNSFITVTADQAMDQARAAEHAITNGRRTGPMHGIPYALKDIYDTAGLLTSGHSARCADRIPTEDATVVRKLREAGAVMLGKLSTHEFATGGPSFDLPWPPARNPWDTARFPGGSSSGSGAAVAADLAPLAMGTDTGGSIRLPAAFCGVAGVKPTYGRVSKRGVLPLSWTMDNAGPLARTAADCAIALQAIAGFDPADPDSADVRVPDFSAALSTGLKGVRIGLIRHFYETDRRAAEPVVAAMDATIALLRSLGAVVTEITLQPIAVYQSCLRVIVLAESFAIHGDRLRTRPQDYGEVFRYRIIPGAFVSGIDYIQAQRYQRALFDEMLATFAQVDVLLTAGTWNEAPLLETMVAEANFAAPPLSSPFNISGLPTISLCNGFGPAGMPLSLQLAAAPFDEPMMIRVAHAYEQAAGWHTRRPTIPTAQATITPPDQLGAPATPAARDAWRSMSAAAGLDLDTRQLDQLCEAMPHVDAMRAVLPRGLPLSIEPANTFRVPAYTGAADHAG